MNPYVLIIICAFTLAGQAICFKIFSSEYRRGPASHFLHNIFFLSLVVIVLILIEGGLRPAENPATYIYSLLFGIFWVISIMFFTLGMGMGPTGIVTLFFTFGLIVPIIVDLTVLGTPIRLFQVVGLILLLLSFYLGNRPLAGEDKTMSIRFIIVCVLSFVFNGLIMATAKLHQGTMPGIDVDAFLIYGFILTVLISLVCFVFFHIKQTRKEKISYSYMFKSPKYYIVVAGSSLTTALGNLLMVIIAGLVPAAIQFPLVSGGTTIITAVLSILLFQEKLTKRMAIVFIIGIAALAIINL